ncbi:MAG TPA: shikimate dehydrogenase [Opitutaceae bacterium]|nr:shikimate dehydrogenase [Opitutaceae bacterium]HND61001.1 shikimate dehydrogenase [Opitutaceae bacterium]
MAPVLTLRELEHWSRPGTSLAVLGHPIRHSISPPMHNAALADLARGDARFKDWEYFRFDVPPADLPAALRLLHAKRFRGVNLTVPHKVLAFDLVAAVAPAARPVGAVNTLLWTDAGWHGHNTDGYGLAEALHSALGANLAGAHVILLGAGGAARSAAVECLQRGCASLNIANRTRGNLDALLEVLAPLAPGIPHRGFAPDAPPDDLPAGAIVVNATSAGLHDSDPAPIDLQRLPRPASVCDMIYNPPRTRLLRQAESLGLPSANGLAMLVHQGAKALEIWSGVPAARTAPVMQEAATRALAAH